MKIYSRNFFRSVLIALVTVAVFSASVAGNSPTTPRIHEYRVAVDFGLVTAQGMGSTQSWTKFQDPIEQAFAVEVPQGWTVRGGLFRLGISDVRPMLDMTSPDGRVNVRLGDLTISDYAVPAQPNTQEGNAVDLGAQAQMVVARYRSGPEFAVIYSHARFRRECQQAAGDAMNVDFAVPNYMPEEAPPTRTSTGEIAYRCGTGAAQRIAFAYTRTAAHGNLWTVPALGSFIGPANRVAEARAVLLHTVQTFKMSPQWQQQQKLLDDLAVQYQRARQQKCPKALTQQMRQFEAQVETTRKQVALFEQQQMGTLQDGFSQSLRGVTPTSDPFAGKVREVWTGTKCNYWTNGSGAVVNTDSAPGGGWYQIQMNLAE